MLPRNTRSPRGLALTAGLFGLTLGAYFPVWLARTWAELRAAGNRRGALTPLGAAVLALVPVLNIAGLAYLAVAVPRAIRRGAGAADPPRDADTEVVSALMIAAVAGGAGLALLIGVSPLLAGYLAFPLELPAALLVQRHLDAWAADRGARPTSATREPRRDRETAAALAIALFVLGGGGIALAVSGDDDDSASTHPPSTTSSLAAASDIAVSPQAVWETRIEEDAVQRLDPKTLAPLGSPIKVGREPLDVVYGLGSIWVANRTSGNVTRIDPASGRIVGRPLPTGRAPWGLAIGRGAVWVANQVERTVDRIDPATGRVRKKVGAAGIGARGIAVGEGAVWVANFEGATVSRIDPSSGSSRQIRIGGAAQDVTTGYGSVWVTRPNDGQVSVLDPQGRRRGAPIQVGSVPSSVTTGLGLVWVANSSSGTVVRIDPRTRRVTGEQLPFDQGISDITIAAGALWVLQSDGTVHRKKVARP